MFNNGKAIRGRPLQGYSARCGEEIDFESHKVLVGCGTALADVHYTCLYCKGDEVGNGSEMT